MWTTTSCTVSRIFQLFLVKGPDKVQQPFTALAEGKRVTVWASLSGGTKKRFSSGQNKKILSLPEFPDNLGWKGWGFLKILPRSPFHLFWSETVALHTKKPEATSWWCKNKTFWSGWRLPRIVFVCEAWVVGCIENVCRFGPYPRGHFLVNLLLSRRKISLKKKSLGLILGIFYLLLWVQQRAGGHESLHWLCSSWGRETEVRILYNLPVVIQWRRCQTMARRGIFRNEFNRAFSHPGWEQRLQMVLEISLVGSWWPPSPMTPWVEMDGDTQGVLAPCLLTWHNTQMEQLRTTWTSSSFGIEELFFAEWNIQLEMFSSGVSQEIKCKT